MTIHALERFPSLKEMSPFRKRRVSKHLATAALPPEVAPLEQVQTSPQNQAILNRIEEIKQMPPELIDHELSNLVALTHNEEFLGDTEEIPAILTDAIHDTAEKLVDEWGIGDHTYMSVMALTDAYALTHDQHLIEKAVDVVHASPHFVEYLPHVAKAVELSAETGEDFHTAIEHVSKRTQDIHMAVREHPPVKSSPDASSDYAEVPSMEAYEDLFDPTIKRPDTPEYTSGGIHPSL